MLAIAVDPRIVALGALVLGIAALTGSHAAAAAGPHGKAKHEAAPVGRAAGTHTPPS